MMVLDQVIGEQYGRINEGVKTHLDLLKAEMVALGGSGTPRTTVSAP